MRSTRRSPLLLLLLSALALPTLAPAQARELAGRVVAADGDGVAGVRVVVRTEAGEDSVRTDSAGDYAVLLPPAIPGEWLRVRVEGGAAHHEAQAMIALDTLPRVALDVVLVPRVWVVREGAFRGDTVAVRLNDAFEAWCDRCSRFLRLSDGPNRKGRPTPVPSWPDSLFPLRVAFERDGNPRVAPQDSLAFWSVVDAMEEEMGIDLFRPVPLAETEPTDDEAFPEDVVLVVMDPSLDSAGYGGTGASAGDILHATVRFREGRIFSAPHAPHLVRHEMMHALGFGHTCSWRTVLAAPGCPGLRALSLTREDVAHAQLLHRLSSLQRARRGSLGLESAVR